jgi:hypothetical protein
VIFFTAAGVVFDRLGAGMVRSSSTAHATR